MTEGRVLYTRNTEDFARLDSDWRDAGRTHAGIIVVTVQQLPVRVQLRALQKISTLYDSKDMLERLEFLLESSMRVHHG